ncbi:hypothetical protein D3C83_58970 [compost metagenome]
MFSATRLVALRFGKAADYLSGIASVGGYFAGIVVLGPYAFGEPVIPVDDPFDVWMLIVLSIFFGLVAGHGFRNASKDIDAVRANSA